MCMHVAVCTCVCPCVFVRVCLFVCGVFVCMHVSLGTCARERLYNLKSEEEIYRFRTVLASAHHEIAPTEVVGSVQRVVSKMAKMPKMAVKSATHEHIIYALSPIHVPIKEFVFLREKSKCR